MDAITQVPMPANEPVHDYAPHSAERTRLLAELAALNDQPIELPHVIGGTHRTGAGQRIDVVQPHRHAARLGTLTNAGHADATAAIESLRPDKLLDPHACGHAAVRGLLAEGLRRNLRATAVDLRNSGDVTGDRGRVVGYGAYVFEPAEEARLPAAMAEGLLGLARTVIVKGAGAADMPKLEIQGVPRPLLAHRAAFVTLRQNGELRGCRGSMAS